MERLRHLLADKVWHLLALLLPLPLLYPLIPAVFQQFSTRIPSGPNDNIAYVWVMHWLGRVLAQGADLFYDPSTYYPVGYPVTAIETTLANSLLFAPVTLLFGPVVAYNTAVIASFALTSYGMFLWVHAFTRRRLLALAAGLVGAFVPYHTAYLAGGQLPQIAMQWIPLTLFALERYVRARRWGWMVLAGGLFGLNALSSWYNLVFLTLAAPAYFALRAGRPLLRRRAFWGHAMLGVVVAVALVLPAALPYLRANQRENRSWHARFIALYSVNPLHFFTPGIRHPVWGASVAQNWPTARPQLRSYFRVVFAGYLTVLGAAVGLVLSRQRRLTRALGAVAAIGVISAMGPLLVGNDGAPVTVPVPQEVTEQLDRAGLLNAVKDWLGPDYTEHLRAESRLVIPLPYALVNWLPIFSSLRAVSRYSILMHLALTGLAALGADALIRRARQRWQAAGARVSALSAAAICVAACVALFEFWMLPVRTTELRRRPVDEWLANQPFGAVIELPLDKSSQRLSVYAQLEHRQPLALGMQGSFPPPVDGERRAVLEQLPDADAVKEMCTWGVRYIVITEYPWISEYTWRDDSALAHWRSVLENTPAVRKVGTIGTSQAYVLDGCS